MDVELVEVRDFLARCAPFDDLPASVLDRLPARLTQRYHRRGSVIVDAGQSNDTLHIIRTGAVEVCDPEGTLLDTRDEGDCFGYSTLVHGGASRYRMDAVADTLLLEMPRETFDELAEKFPSIRDFFGERSDRIREDLASARVAAAGGDALGTPVGELLTRDAVTTGPDTSIRDAARIMTDRRVSALLVVEDEVVTGIFTDRDLRSKVVAAGADPAAAVSTIMTPDPVSVDVRTRAFDATLLQIDRGVHHLPVCDNGAPVGMVTTGDLLRLAQADPVYLAARISRAPDTETVAALSRRLPEIVGEFVRRGTAPQDIGRVITATADAATRRLLVLAEDELGSPPVPYCWVGLGSQARGEMGVASDQDNALVLADDAATVPGGDEYFAALAERVCGGLDRAGFPLCPGEVMASNPAWRHTTSGWMRRVADWVGAPEPEPMVHAQVFFDIRAVHGPCWSRFAVTCSPAPARTPASRPTWPGSRANGSHPWDSSGGWWWPVAVSTGTRWRSKPAGSPRWCRSRDCTRWRPGLTRWPLWTGSTPRPWPGWWRGATQRTSPRPSVSFGGSRTGITPGRSRRGTSRTTTWTRRR